MKYKNTLTVLLFVTTICVVVFDIRQRSKFVLTRDTVKYPHVIDTGNGTESTVTVTNVSMDPNWRDIELGKLGDLIQRRLSYIQNPKNCQETKKVLCTHTKTAIGYGSQMHDWIACLIAAYATQRTLIVNTTGWHYARRGLETLFLPLSTNCTSTENQQVIGMSDLSNIDDIPVVQLPRSGQIKKRPNYLPYAIPDDIADDISRIHKDPSIWWIGQFLVYITRPNRHFNTFIQDSFNASEFLHPIVGVHVRRTDKRSVARYHNLEEYMAHVEAWFDDYEKDHKVDHRRVYLVSDDDGVLNEARKRYQSYTFLSNKDASVLAKRKTTRYSESSLRGLVLDIDTLSMCDFVVCTLTSNVARLVYLLMSARYWDAPDRIHSLDTGYSFTGTLMTNELLDKKRKKSNNLSVIPDASKNPLKPLVAIDNAKSVVKMPTYPDVPRV